MDIRLLHIASFISIFSSLIPFMVGLKRIRTNAMYLKLLFVLTGVSFLCDMASIILIKAKISPNQALNLYTLAEFAILLTVYYQVFGNRKWFKPFLGLGISYVLFFTLNVFFFQQKTINSFAETFSALVFIALSVAYFYQLMKELPTLQIHRLPMFWINTSVLIYFAGNLFVFILVNYLVTVLKNDLAVYWTFHNLLNIIKNLLLAIGLWQNLRTPKLL